MQKITHNGNEYTSNELRQMLYKGELPLEEYNALWTQIQALERATEVQEYFDFSNEQMEEMIGNENQMRLLYDAMHSLEQIDELQEQIDEWTYWADNRPY